MPPDEARFRHHWIMADTAGQDHHYEHLIHHDLARVEKGEASVFVMDSQGELIAHILNDPRFQQGGTLESKVVYLEPDLRIRWRSISSTRR